MVLKNWYSEINIEPLNIRKILSGNIDDPIDLNKQTLNIPNVKVGVKTTKKGKLDINIPNIDIKGHNINIQKVI